LTEERVISGATVSDLDIDVFKTFLQRLGLEVTQAPQPDLVADLRNRGVVDDDGNVARPTLYGLLCFGRQPHSFSVTRSAWLDLVLYQWTDRASEVILGGEARGRVDEQVERAVGWLKGLAIQETYNELERIARPLAPIRALREGLVNAVAHRDYAITGS